MPLVWRTFSRYSPDALRRSLAHHHELVAALTAPDPDWAESVMRSHVRATWHSIRLGDGGDRATGRPARNNRTRPARPRVNRHSDHQVGFCDRADGPRHTRRGPGRPVTAVGQR
ncbi:FCD domain-containing protein [Micromonospora taraxaci]